MSNGSILDLVAKGIQDSDLIDNNNMKSNFDFNIDKKNKYSKGDTLFFPQGKSNWNNTIRFNIEKKGDLLYGLYLVVRLPKLSIANLNTPIQQNENDSNSIYRINYTDYIGNVLIEKISLYFNGSLIDEHYGDYMQFYTDLYLSDWNRKAMLGLDDYMNKPNIRIEEETIYIPFKFWFCNDIKKPLPLIALQNTDIYIDVKFRDFNSCVSVLEKDNNNNLFHSNYIHREQPIVDCHLQANFYYVDLNERKELATKEYEIVITQSQIRNNIIGSTGTLDINFNHVVKDLMFSIQSSTNKNNSEFYNLSGKLEYPPNELKNNLDYNLWTLQPEQHLLSRARILFNGIERIEWRDAKYYYYMQNHENFKNSLLSHFYVYSFNIDPTKFTSTAGCNFSRIDSAQLQVEIKPQSIVINNTGTIYKNNSEYELRCFATNFNVLVIKGGLAGLKYSN
jgi:hypothetical protein